MSQRAKEPQAEQVAAKIMGVQAALSHKEGKDREGQASRVPEEMVQQIIGACDRRHGGKEHADVIDDHGYAGQVFKLCTGQAIPVFLHGAVLMVEQPDPGEGHGDAVLITGVDDMVVPDGAAGLGDIGHAGLSGPLYVVAKGEEGVGAHGHAVLGGDPGGSLRSAGVRTSGRTLKVFCHTPSASTSSYSSEMYRSMALSRSGRRMSSTNWRPRTLGCWRSHQLSALLPARRVQWMRLCWPAPTPMVWPLFT